MATEKELMLAKEAYNTLCAELDQMEWHYKTDDDKLQVFFGADGEDIPMEFLLECDANRQIVRLMSRMPFKFSEEKRVEGALVTCFANYRLADGSFDYNIGDGTIFFRLTSSFRESLVSKEMFEYMIRVSCFTVDKYNDQFLMISKGVLSLEDFIKNN